MSKLIMLISDFKNIIFSFFIIVISMGNTMAQINDNDLYKKFFASINDTVIVQLKNEIESSANSNIQVTFTQMNSVANETLLAGFSESGIPYIKINNGLIPNATEIYHELYHLWIQTKNGIYRIDIAGSLLQTFRIKLENPWVVIYKAHSIFQHAYFYKFMIGHGYHPTLYLLNQLNNCIQGYPNNSYTEDISLHIALDVWHLMLGVEDKNLDTKKYLSILKDKFMQQYELGLKLYRLSQEFQNPIQEPSIFAKILDVLIDGNNFIKYNIENNILRYY